MDSDVCFGSERNFTGSLFVQTTALLPTLNRFSGAPVQTGIPVTVGMMGLTVSMTCTDVAVGVGGSSGVFLNSSGPSRMRKRMIPPITVTIIPERRFLKESGLLLLMTAPAWHNEGLCQNYTPTPGKLKVASRRLKVGEKRAVIPKSEYGISVFLLT